MKDRVLRLDKGATLRNFQYSHFDRTNSCKMDLR
jgi:hypothetical protein